MLSLLNVEPGQLSVSLETHRSHWYTMERLQFSWSLLPYYSAFLAVVAGVYGIFQRDFIGVST